MPVFLNISNTFMSTKFYFKGENGDKLIGGCWTSTLEAQEPSGAFLQVFLHIIT